MRRIGEKFYDIKDHLGNVRLTLNDYKYRLSTASNSLFSPSARSLTNYYPFGMEQMNRSASTGKSRFGYNGKLKDNDLKGLGNSYDYGARFYDPRTARFLSIDPLISTTPWQSGYTYAGNKPITYIDQDGQNEKHYLVTKDKDGNVSIKLYRDVQPPLGLQALQQDIHYYWYNGNQYWFGPDGNYPDPKLEDEFRRNPDKEIERGCLPNPQADKVATEGIPTVWDVGIDLGMGVAVGAIGASTIAKPLSSESVVVKSEKVATETVAKTKKVRNPHGSKGKPDHKEAVEKLAKMAEGQLKAGQAVAKPGTKMLECNRRPDVRIIAIKGEKTIKIFEAERHPESLRNKLREEEYNKLGIENLTYKLGEF